MQGDAIAAPETTRATEAQGLADWLAPGGAVAGQLPGFEVRPQQREMAAAVAEAIAGGHHLAVEAGTGVGKTFAYLLPAIEHILRHKRRVVVSTHTIALQEQLIHKDIPFLQAALSLAGRTEPAAPLHRPLADATLAGGATLPGGSILPSGTALPSKGTGGSEADQVQALPFRAELVKGRQNYLSLRRLKNAASAWRRAPSVSGWRS